MEKQVNRYSDSELEEFKELIEKKLVKARAQLEELQQQIREISENSDEDFGRDLTDDSSLFTSLEMLNDMAIHQEKHIRNLENAMVRIHNKTYGICTITGELIDKRRLMAVPTTTKSLVAKKNIEKTESDQRSSSFGPGFDEEDNSSPELS